MYEFKPAGNAADVVKSLRKLADEIEGKRQDARAVICIVDVDVHEPAALFIWGEARPLNQLAALCLQAQHRFMGALL